jgi:uncharacterized membrane protein YfcA
MEWELVAAGVVVGTLVGMTGMGGGSLMTPLLVFAFGFQPTVAIGTDIVHGAVFKTVGGLRHRRLGTVHARLSGWMFLASAPASLVGVALADWLQRSYGDTTESVGAQVLGAALVVGALGLAAKSFVRYRERTDAAFVMTRRDRIAALLIGAAGGVVVGLTSVGTGVFFGLTMLIVFPLRAARVVGTDIFHAAALLWVAGAGHLAAGNVDLGACAWLLAGSVPGVLLGSRYVLRVPERALRVVLACVLALSGIKLLDVPGGDIIVVVMLVLGAALLVATLLRARLAAATR